jgi:hypothetical protein
LFVAIPKPTLQLFSFVTYCLGSYYRSLLPLARRFSVTTQGGGSCCSYDHVIESMWNYCRARRGGLRITGSPGSSCAMGWSESAWIPAHSNSWNVSGYMFTSSTIHIVARRLVFPFVAAFKQTTKLIGVDGCIFIICNGHFIRTVIYLNESKFFQR